MNLIAEDECRSNVLSSIVISLLDSMLIPVMLSVIVFHVAVQDSVPVMCNPETEQLPISF